MTDWKFSYEERLEDIERAIVDYTWLKQSMGGPISFSDTLIKTIENSIVISIYSLSEQLLKDKIYSILQVRFNDEEQSPKDKYILNQIPPEKHPITPDLDRIKKELKIFYPEFKLYLPKIVDNYKNSYVQLVKARHDYAHANNHTANIDFDAAKRFVEYLKLQYDDIIANEISNIGILEKKLLDLREIENFQHLSSKQTEIEEIRNLVDTIDLLDDEYFIDYIKEVFDSLKDAFNIIDTASEAGFKEDISNFRNALTDFI